MAKQMVPGMANGEEHRDAEHTHGGEHVLVNRLDSNDPPNVSPSPQPMSVAAEHSCNDLEGAIRPAQERQG